MKRHLLHIFVVLLIVTGCHKKKYPESYTENAPVFYARAMINGQSIDLTAGVNGNINNPYFFQDTNGVYKFVSEFKSASCSGNCSNSLYLQINDYTVSAPSGPININSVVNPTIYYYHSDTAKNVFKVQFNSFYNKPAKSYLWDFGDGSTSTLSNPEHSYKTEGNYNVCLQIVGQNGCSSSICNVIDVHKQNPLTVKVSAASAGSTQAYFSSLVSGGQPPYTYYWSFGDTAHSNQPNPVHQYLIGGSYPVVLKVSDANNKTITVNYNYVTANDLSSCASNLNSTITQVLNNQLALSKIVIRWTDSGGKTYTSQNPQQPSSSNLEIISVEDYGTNANGDRLKKIKIRFNCKVYNGSETLSIDNGEAVVAAAYK